MCTGCRQRTALHGFPDHAASRLPGNVYVSIWMPCRLETQVVAHVHVVRAALHGSRELQIIMAMHLIYASGLQRCTYKQCGCAAEHTHPEAHRPSQAAKMITCNINL